MRLFSFRTLGAISAASLALFAAGCGGGSGSTGSAGVVTPVATGRATFTIQWPPRAASKAGTRLIPEAANSVKIELFDGVTSLGFKTAQRNGLTSSIVFDELPVRTLTAQVTSYASTDTTGVALSVGSSPVAITASGDTPATVSMVSTIDTLSVDYTSPNILKDETATVHVSARDNQGRIVTYSPSKLTWTSSDATKVDVAKNPDGSATLTGTGAGTPTVTVTDTESGKSKAFAPVGMTFALSSAATTVSVNDPFAFNATVAGLANNNVTWSVVEGATGGSIDSTGHYTAPTAKGTGTYHVRATAVGDPTRTMTATVTVQSGSASVTIQ